MTSRTVPALSNIGKSEIESFALSVLHGPDSPQAQQEVVAGDQRQIHDLSRGREKPVSRAAVRAVAIAEPASNIQVKKKDGTAIAPIDSLSAYAQPRAKPSAPQISLKRSELSIATRRPRWALETVTTLWRLMAHVAFIPSFSVRRTSDGTPRMVEVMGATVTADK